MKMTTASHPITPFWHRIPAFLAYPFRPPLIWLLLAGLPLMLIPFVNIAVILAIGGYGYCVMARTAE